ncbi:hypothetical protein GQ457_10G012800 [Hibiscus cannabinus]
MTRRKVELAWITNQSARRASLKKRRAGLLKKVLELTTLCGIKACLVMYSPGEQEPMTWPSPDETKELIKKFYFVPELERSKRTMTMEMYMTEKLSKVQNDLTKLNMKNKEAEVGQYMLQIHHGKIMEDFNVHELEALIWFGETKRTILRKRVEFYKQVSYPLAGPSEGDVPLQPLPQGPTTSYYDIRSVNPDIGDRERVTAASLDWDNWYHNLMNPNEFRGGGSSSSVRSYMSLTHYNPYARYGSSSVAPHVEQPGSSTGGSSSVAAQLVQPGSSIGGTSIVVVADLGLPRPLIGGNSSAAMEQGQPRHPFGGEFSSSSTDLGLSGPSFGSSSRAVSNQGLPLFPTFDNSMYDVGFPEGDYLGPFGGHDGESSSNAAASSNGSEMEPSDDRD